MSSSRGSSPARYKGRNSNWSGPSPQRSGRRHSARERWRARVASVGRRSDASARASNTNNARPHALARRGSRRPTANTHQPQSFERERAARVPSVWVRLTARRRAHDASSRDPACGRICCCEVLESRPRHLRERAIGVTRARRAASLSLVVRVRGPLDGGAAAARRRRPARRRAAAAARCGAVRPDGARGRSLTRRVRDGGYARSRFPNRSFLTARLDASVVAVCVEGARAARCVLAPRRPRRQRRDRQTRVLTSPRRG